MLNRKLAEILDWACAAGVDLDQTEIVLSHKRYDYDTHKETTRPCVTFYHEREMADNIRQLKRVVKLEPKGDPPYLALKALIMLGETEVEIRYEGAYECTVSHSCKPKGWEDHQLVSNDNEEMEEVE